MNLIEGIQLEIERVSELVIEYEDLSLKGAGAFAAMFMKTDIKLAKDAIGSGADVVELLRIYKKLNEYTS